MPVLTVKVKPSASVTKFKGSFEVNGEKILKIDLAAPPEKGKANQELIRFLSKKLRINRNNIRIVSGEKSREKKIEITGMDFKEILKNLEG